MVSMG